jgi:putative redox protein
LDENLGRSQREARNLITCYGKKAHFDTWFTNGKHEGHCDAPVEKGGGDAGFGPHELLEAALAGCLNIWVRVYAGRS